MTMVWEELLADILVRLDQETAEEGDPWPEPVLRLWTNDCLKDIGSRLMLHRDIKSIATVADQAEYEMPDDFVKGYRLEYRQSSSYVRELEPSTIEAMEGVRGVLRTSGWPTAWSTWGYAGGGGQIILDRAPSESLDDGLRLYYYRLPRTITALSDVVDVPTGTERNISYYVEAQARRKEAQDSRWREAMQLYESGLEEMRKTYTLHHDQPRYIHDDHAYGRATAIFGDGY